MFKKLILSGFVASGIILTATDVKAGPIRHIVSRIVHGKSCGSCSGSTSSSPQTLVNGNYKPVTSPPVLVNGTVYSSNVGPSTVSSCANGKCPLVPTTGLFLPRK